MCYYYIVLDRCRRSGPPPDPPAPAQGTEVDKRRGPKAKSKDPSENKNIHRDIRNSPLP